jgi:hypothetical protein
MEDIRKEDYVNEYNKCRAEFQAAMIKTELPEVSKRINTLIEESSLARKLFTVEMLAPGQKAIYPVSDDFEAPVWILPSLGYVAQDYMELMAEEVSIPLFMVQAAKDWMLKYDEEGRVDILQRAIQDVARNIISYEDEGVFRVIWPAVTSSFDGAGVLPPRPAPVYQLPAGDPASGYLSKELINRMIVGAKRMGQTLVELEVSPEDLADIREWTDTDVDPATRHSIFRAAGMGDIWGIQLREVEHLGVRGKFNINDKTSEFGPFKGNAKENRFNDYHISPGHGNIVDQNGNLVVPGETQIVGLCESHKDSLVMPMKQSYKAHYDWTLLRKHKTGFFGWQEFGLACLNPRCLLTGVIDRYTPDFYSASAEWVALQAEKEAERESKKINWSTPSSKMTMIDFIETMVGLLRIR